MMPILRGRVCVICRRALFFALLTLSMQPRTSMRATKLQTRRNPSKGTALMNNSRRATRRAHGALVIPLVIIHAMRRTLLANPSQALYLQVHVLLPCDAMHTCAVTPRRSILFHYILSLSTRSRLPSELRRACVVFSPECSCMQISLLVICIM